MLSTPQTLQRKKSLPDVAGMPRLPDGAGMPREEVSALGSARREEIRRMYEESEKLRANPLLYLVSPQVKVTCISTYLSYIATYFNYRSEVTRTLGSQIHTTHLCHRLAVKTFSALYESLSER